MSTAHGALFLFGPGLALAPQRTTKASGHCGASEHEDFTAVIVLSFIFVFVAFASFVIGSFVKARVPPAAADGAAGGGLQSLDATDRRMCAGSRWPACSSTSPPPSLLCAHTPS